MNEKYLEPILARLRPLIIGLVKRPIEIHATNGVALEERERAKAILEANKRTRAAMEGARRLEIKAAILAEQVRQLRAEAAARNKADADRAVSELIASGKVGKWDTFTADEWRLAFQQDPGAIALALGKGQARKLGVTR